MFCPLLLIPSPAVLAYLRLVVLISFCSMCRSFTIERWRESSCSSQSLTIMAICEQYPVFIILHQSRCAAVNASIKIQLIGKIRGSVLPTEFPLCSFFVYFSALNFPDTMMISSTLSFAFCLIQVDLFNVYSSSVLFIFFCWFNIERFEACVWWGLGQHNVSEGDFEHLLVNPC